MTVSVVAGVFLLLAGPAVHQRATVLLLQRWHTLKPLDWAEAMRPARRILPFGAVLRSQIVHERASVWQWSTPSWVVNDLIATTLLKQIRMSPFISLLGFLLLAATAVIG